MTSNELPRPKSHSLRSAPQPRRTGRDGLADTATDGGVVPGGQIRHKLPFDNRRRQRVEGTEVKIDVED